MTLPGVGQTGDGVDGPGAAASFGYLGVMCAGSDGLLYVTDNRQVRTVDTNGTVGTIVTPNVNQQRVLACGPDGSILMRRWFLNPAENDYYDPIARKSIAKVSSITTDIFSVYAYFGTSNPRVLVESGSVSSSVELINLTDGTSTTVVKSGSPANLLGSPPVIDETPLRAGTAINAKDFSLLSNHAIYKFAQK
ncbi:MAG: hypothetical protein I8H77_03705 [Comamonadaceae bacterium]|nr:hypothetical protein [Comamonadaceae bacterium]